MCCCINPNDPLVIRRAKFFAVIQIVLESVLLVVSLSTVRDGGYLGVAASFLGLTGCTAVLMRRSTGYLTWILANVAGFLLGIAQTVLMVRLLATVDDWCCEIETNTKSAMRALLTVLVALYLSGALLRLYVAFGPAPKARGVAGSLSVAPVAGVRAQQGAVAVGVPVVVDTSLPVVEGRVPGPPSPA